MLTEAISGTFGLALMALLVLAAERFGESLRPRADLPPAPSARAARRRERSSESLALRAIVRLRRPTLDWKLAEHPDLSRSRQLRLRADQLTRVAARAVLADRLEQLLEDTAAPNPDAPSTAASLRRQNVVDAQVEIVELVAALRTSVKPSAYGVARAARLLSDGLGPLHDPHPRGTLRDTLRSIIAELQLASVPVLEDLWRHEC